jgi:hypothetical protein
VVVLDENICNPMLPITLGVKTLQEKAALAGKVLRLD